MPTVLTVLTVLTVPPGHSHRSLDAGALSSGLAALSQPFKLRLSRAAGATSSLRDYSAQVLLSSRICQ